jgi:hypothetical protein
MNISFDCPPTWCWNDWMNRNFSRSI